MVNVPLNPADLGLRLRSLRKAAGLSVEAMALNSGVSKSMISEVERGGRVPTIVTLDQLATSLGTSIARLLSPEVKEDVTILRHAEQPLLREANWERRILSPVLHDVEFEFMRTVLQPGADAGTYEPHGTESREYIAVESGELTLSLDGIEHVLAEGDSIYFPGGCHHGFRNTSLEPCVYYLVMDLGKHEDGAMPPLDGQGVQP